jgi:hypothetical protein
MQLAQIKIYYEGSLLAYETMRFYISVLNIKPSKVVSIPRMRQHVAFSICRTKRSRPCLLSYQIGSNPFGPQLAGALCMGFAIALGDEPRRFFFFYLLVSPGLRLGLVCVQIFQGFHSLRLQQVLSLCLYQVVNDLQLCPCTFELDFLQCYYFFPK